MTRALPLAIALFAAGCALIGGTASRFLTDADAAAARGEYAVAVARYDVFLARYPDDGAVERVRRSRALLAELLAARDEAAALRERLADATRARGELAVEITRLRQELTARQTETARLRQSLEDLKRTDLELERRRR